MEGTSREANGLTVESAIGQAQVDVISDFGKHRRYALRKSGAVQPRYVRPQRAWMVWKDTIHTTGSQDIVAGEHVVTERNRHVVGSPEHEGTGRRHGVR